MQVKVKASVSVEEIKKAAEEYIFQTLPQEVSEEQKQFLINLCAHLGLDPYKGEVHFVAYKEMQTDPRTGRKVPTGKYSVRPVVSYLVYIKRALATGKLAGWKVELKKEENKIKAVTTIHRKDFTSPFVWEVYLEEARRDTSVWKEQPLFMLRKVCIAQAFRLAFPEAVGELPYAEEEVVGLNNEESEAIEPLPESIPESKVKVVELEAEEKKVETSQSQPAGSAEKVEKAEKEKEEETKKEEAPKPEPKPTQEVRGLF